jgi:hypothetical protein
LFIYSRISFSYPLSLHVSMHVTRDTVTQFDLDNGGLGYLLQPAPHRPRTHNEQRAAGWRARGQQRSEAEAMVGMFV